METLPDIASDVPLTKRPNQPSYTMAQTLPTSPTADDIPAYDIVDGEELEEKEPQAPTEPDLPSPACLTDGSNEQIPREYIQKWKVYDSNKEQRLKELGYTLKLLKAKSMSELVTNPKHYDKDFYLLAKGMYRMHNHKYVNRKLVLQTLLSQDILIFFKNYWNAIMVEFESKRTEANKTNGELWESYTKTQTHIVDALSNCGYIQIIIWNGSDMQIPETLTVLYNEIADFTLKSLDKDLYPLIDSIPSTHPQHKAVKACLGIIHNFCNKHDGAITDLREKDGLKTIGKYRNSGTMTLKTKSILAYSYLLSENDQNQNKSVIELEEADIAFVIKALRDALDSKQEHSKKFGYHADELITGLNNIAVVDSNKRRLVDAGVLPLYVEAMGRRKPALQEYAAQGVWTLAFDEASKKTITEEPGCLDALRKLTQSSNKNVKAAAEGALWKLEGETKHLQLISANPGKNTKKKLQHVMISYQWDVQPQVIEFRNRLRAEGYRVWIDVEQMSGNTLDAMARAVENSVCVIPVLTERYKKSLPCQQELKYACKLDKKMVPIRLQPRYRPDGWLAFIISDAFYYDLTKADEYEKKIQEFLLALGNDGKILPGEDENPVNAEPEETENNPENLGTFVVPSHAGAPNYSDDSMPSANFKTIFNVTRLKCANWNKDQVSGWLKSNELDKYIKKFAGMDGRLLAELAAVQFISPDAYYPLMRQEHSMPMLDILRLNAALRELNPASC